MRTDFKIGLAIGLFIIVGMGLYFVFTSGGQKVDKGQEQAKADKDRHGERPRTSIKGDQIARADQPKPPEPTRSPERTTPAGGNSNNTPSMSTQNDWFPGNNSAPTRTADPVASTENKTPSTPKASDTGSGTTAKPSGTGDFVKSDTIEKKPDVPKTPVLKIEEPKSTDIARDTNKTEPTKSSVTTQEPAKTTGGTAGKGAGTEYEVVKPSNPTGSASTAGKSTGPQLNLPDLNKTATPAPTATAAPAGNQQEGIYVVQAGDNGFWAISQKVYGDGRYHDMIAKANPDADPLRLQKGQRIKVPPLPTVAGAAAGTTGATGVQHGSVVSGVDGKKYYVVKAGDSGFWGIAEKQYGNGKYHTLIEKANPDADPHNLKVGQKLLLPEKPTEAVASGGTTTTGGTTTAAPAGSTTYVVQETDNRGLWGIAEKQYGNGQLWTLIQQANNNIEAAKLKPGMKLIIPPASGIERTASGSTGTVESPARRTPSGGGERTPAPTGVIRDPDTPTF